MAEAKLSPVLFEGVRLIFRNFKGVEDKYNKEGDRNFGVIIPPDEDGSYTTAKAMEADDWNVKWLKPGEDSEDDTETPWLPVAVEFRKGRPPVIAVITSRGRTNLAESEVESLDYLDIVNVDMVINPSRWNVQEKSGVKAYLKTMFVTIEEDPLEAKYAEMNAQ